MKKILLILSAVLLLFSFVSCKDSSEDIVAVYEEYKATEVIKNRVYGLFNCSGGFEGTVKYTLTEKDTETTSLAPLFKALGIEEEPATIESVSGTMEVTRVSGTDIEYKDIEIKYTISGSEEVKTFTLSGTYKANVPDASVKGVTNDDYSFKLNGKEYSLSNSRISSERKYTRAVVNGKNVEIRLLNSRIESAT